MKLSQCRLAERANLTWPRAGGLVPSFLSFVAKGWGLTFLTRGFGFYGKPVIGFGFAFSAGLFRT